MPSSAPPPRERSSSYLSHPALRRTATSILGVLVLFGVVACPRTQANTAPSHPAASGFSQADIPDSAAAALSPNTTLPSTALYVSTSGADTNRGTVDSPLRTLAKALTRVGAGGTVVVRGGLYREGIADPSSTGYGGLGTVITSLPSGVTIENYPGEQVWFDGTEVATGFTRASDADYSVAWSAPGLCGGQFNSTNFAHQSASGPCSYYDEIGGTASLGDPLMVFRDGTAVPEVASAADRTSNSFWYDQSTHQVHLGFNPQGSTIEITRRPQAVAFHAPTNLTLRGLGFTRFASNQYTNATQGAVLVSEGSNLVIDRCAFTKNAGAGIRISHTTGVTIRHSYISENGFNGLFLNGEGTQHLSNSALVDNVLIEYSRVDHNNTDGYGVSCSLSCSAAGLKATGVVNMTARYNSFSSNERHASGVWCDQYCIGWNVYGNVVSGNSRSGIFTEVSDKAIVFSNLVTGNANDTHIGAGLMLGSANVDAYNNTVMDNYNNVLLYDDSRTASAATGPDTVNVRFVNNIVTGGAQGRPMIDVRGGSASGSANTTPTTFLRTMDNNSYWWAPNTASWWFLWEERPNQVELSSSVAALRAKHPQVESHSDVSTASTDPLMVSPSTGDLRPAGPAVGSGALLPTEIASLVGASTSSAPNRGVLTLGGSTTSSTASSPTTLATDSFTRTVANGWGSASTGGTWNGSSSALSVSSGQGHLTPTGQTLASVVLSAAGATNQDLLLTTAVTRSGSGTGGDLQFFSARTVSTGSYAAKLYTRADGATTVTLVRLDAQGTEAAALGSSTFVGSLASGTPLKVRVEVSGTSPTTVRVRVWAATAQEPTTWTLQASDSTAGLQAAGPVGVRAQLTTGSTFTADNAIDDVTVTQLS